MSILFAHHIEAYHVPVLLGLFTAGAWIGWEALSKWLPRNPPK